MEKTLIILKPDAVERKLIGEIISRFEKKGFNIEALKMITISKEVALEHYAHVKDKPIFNDMIEFMTSAPSIVIMLSGEQVVSTVRNMIGKTISSEALPGSIRGDFGSHPFKNLIHASDCPTNSLIELKRFFPEIKEL